LRLATAKQLNGYWLATAAALGSNCIHCVVMTLCTIFIIKNEGLYM